MLVCRYYILWLEHPAAVGFITFSQSTVPFPNGTFVYSPNTTWAPGVVWTPDSNFDLMTSMQVVRASGRIGRL